MVDPALGIDATVVSTMDVGFGPSNMDKDITCDKGHTQPSSDGCNFEAGVLGERHLANMVRWNTGTTKDSPGREIPLGLVRSSSLTTMGQMRPHPGHMEHCTGTSST